MTVAIIWFLANDIDLWSDIPVALLAHIAGKNPLCRFPVVSSIAALFKLVSNPLRANKIQLPELLFYQEDGLAVAIDA